jgi:hypothetical protein
MMSYKRNTTIKTLQSMITSMILIQGYKKLTDDDDNNSNDFFFLRIIITEILVRGHYIYLINKLCLKGKF